MVVPQYLQAAAQEQGLLGELIPAANRINDAMPRLVVDKLERALELFDRGMKLSLDCETFLKAAEQRVEILKRTAQGLITEPFEHVALEAASN